MTYRKTTATEPITCPFCGRRGSNPHNQSCKRPYVIVNDRDEPHAEYPQPVSKDKAEAIVRQAWANGSELYYRRRDA